MSHSYTDGRHPMVNDPGHWIVQCSGCNEPFCVIGLHDVFDSYGTDMIILDRVEGHVLEVLDPVAQEVAQYNLDLNEQIGRAQVRTPVHNEHLVYQLLIEKTKNK